MSDTAYMLQASPVLPAGAPRAATAVAIDLIGDLDANLATMFGETLHGIIGRGDSDVIVNFSHVAVVHAEGLASVLRTIVESRLSGPSISVLAGSRHIRSLLKSARIPVTENPETLGRERHVMIARHAQ